MEKIESFLKSSTYDGTHERAYFFVACKKKRTLGYILFHVVIVFKVLQIYFDVGL